MQLQRNYRQQTLRSRRPLRVEMALPPSTPPIPFTHHRHKPPQEMCTLHRCHPTLLMPPSSIVLASVARIDVTPNAGSPQLSRSLPLSKTFHPNKIRRHVPTPATRAPPTHSHRTRTNQPLHRILLAASQASAPQPALHGNAFNLDTSKLAEEYRELSQCGEGPPVASLQR